MDCFRLPCKRDLPGYHAIETIQSLYINSPSQILRSNAGSAECVVDIADEFVHGTPARTVIPLAAIPNTSDLVCKSDCTALGYVVFLASHHAGSEQISALSFIADARVELLKVKTVFHGTAFDKVSFWNVWIVGYHAIGIAQPHLHVGIDLCGAEEDNIAKAFTGSMFARDIIIGFRVKAAAV